MAATDPRRSSRARATQSHSQSSSSTSSISGRPERSSRFNKGVSPQKSTSTGSLSSEPPEDTIAAEETFGTRRRTRGQAEDKEKAGNKTDTSVMANRDNDAGEEDEAVRCVCGNEEYQGPPPLDEDSKHGFKHSYGLDAFFSTDVTDDTAGLFVQCDICKVWQHGGCVGIMTEESSPDEYFCEKCRQDLHRLWTASNGSVYSHYLPLKRHGRAASRAAAANKESLRSPTKDTKEKDAKAGRTSSQNQTSKRRSTLNSREAGYDEAEALRRAIEASKEDALPADQQENRRPKRGRSDSQEKSDNAKRQKTSSRSASPVSDKNADDSDDGRAIGRNGTRAKSRNAVSARNNRTTEKPSEKEERERQRADAANKRKGRADRRRADDSDPSEEVPLAARSTANKATGTTTAAAAAAAAQASSTTTSPNTSAPATFEATKPPALAASDPQPTSNPAPDTPTPPATTTQSKSDNKKRSHKKKGRNQYTRDRDAEDDSPGGRSQSRDIQRDEPTPSGSGSNKPSGDGVTKANPKAKGGMSSKITMNDMKRRAAALLEFISRTQVELAGEAAANEMSAAAAAAASEKAAGTNGVSAGGVTVTVTSPDDKPQDDSLAAVAPERDFKELGCLEMMDSLTRRLVKWQQQYAA
ncbi:hypothetical protein VTJ49DRAFT_2415 [Mycothermus thermophilus]|uniref:Zinc finger PHD-type domain-containing protein n=1 Tax=Humicola insolens TaxID=85995 RepID=A0ABR3VA25_HUMIN